VTRVQGAEYRRHRVPVQGSFSERNNRMVWDTSSAIVQQLVNSGSWKDQDSVQIHDIRDMTVPVCFLVQHVPAAL